MKKTCKRTVRDPRGWIDRRQPISSRQQDDLSIAYRMSLQSMLRGHGTEQTWSTLACALNVALLLAEEGICGSGLETIIQAQNALIRTRELSKKRGKWAFDGEAMTVVLAATNLHDEQLERATRAQIVCALKEVYRRIELGEVMQ